MASRLEDSRRYDTGGVVLASRNDPANPDYPSPEKVLRRVLQELHPAIDRIEVLTIRQASPTQYAVRVQTRYRGDETNLVIDVQ